MAFSVELGCALQESGCPKKYSRLLQIKGKSNSLNSIFDNILIFNTFSSSVFFREIEAMKGIAAAHKSRDLHEFEKVRDEYKDGARLGQDRPGGGILEFR